MWLCWSGAGAVTVEAANAALAARGAAPLTANSREMAEATREGLINDDDFAARYLRGDPEAVSQLYQADLRVKGSAGKLTDRPAAPGDFNINVASHLVRRIARTRPSLFQ